LNFLTAIRKKRLGRKENLTKKIYGNRFIQILKEILSSRKSSLNLKLFLLTAGVAEQKISISLICYLRLGTSQTRYTM
jgi:hypothetical protein